MASTAAFLSRLRGEEARESGAGAPAPCPPTCQFADNAPPACCRGKRGLTCHDCLAKDPVAHLAEAARFAIRSERASDVAGREALLDACFGEDRDARTCQRLRAGRAPAEGLAFSAVRQGRVVGTIRLWHVSAGGVAALVLGPLAVDPSCRDRGIGAALMYHALTAAKRRGHGAVILLGDAPYYGRFGFSALKTGELSLPGPFERGRLLGLELREGALDGAWGMIVPTATAARQSKPRLAARLRKSAPHAA